MEYERKMDKQEKIRMKNERKTVEKWIQNNAELYP